MKILPGFSTEDEAKQTSADIFGPWDENQTTHYMFGWIKNPNADEWGLLIPEGLQDYLTEEQVSALIENTWEVSIPLE